MTLTKLMNHSLIVFNWKHWASWFKTEVVALDWSEWRLSVFEGDCWGGDRERESSLGIDGEDAGLRHFVSFVVRVGNFEVKVGESLSVEVEEQRLTYGTALFDIVTLASCVGEGQQDWGGVLHRVCDSVVCPCVDECQQKGQGHQIHLPSDICHQNNSRFISN